MTVWLLLLAAASVVGGDRPVVPPALSALCPKAGPGEIVVCADPEPPKSPYRLPLGVAPVAGDRDTVSVSAERNALFDHDAGGSGLCSSVGPGGAWGCSYRDLKRSERQRAGASDKRGWIFVEPAH